MTRHPRPGSGDRGLPWRVPLVVAVAGALMSSYYVARTGLPSAHSVSPLVGEPVISSPAAAPPDHLTVGRVRVSAPITTDEMDVRGDLLVPRRSDVVGWYSGSAVPGADSGSAVLVGHVTGGRGGSGALAPLGRTRRGDTVTVRDRRGRSYRYRIERVARFHHHRLPLSQIFDAGGSGRLVVVTCGGRLTGSDLGYEDNLVVTASPLR